MKNRLKRSLILAAIVHISLIYLEFYYTNFYQGFPFAIFAILFVESFIIFYICFALYEKFVMKQVKISIKTIAQIILLTILVFSYTHIFLDQLPCFLGGKGC